MPKRLAAALFVVLAASACKGPTDPSDNTVDTFTGIVQVGGSDTKEFTVANTGEINITLVALTPGNASIGVGYGQFAGGNCGLLRNTTASNLNVGRTLLVDQIFIKGQYCLIVYDLVNLAPLTVAQTYTMQVSHP